MNQMSTRSHLPDNNPQLDLLGGVDAQPAEVHRLFFALLPNDATRVQLAHAVDVLRASNPGLLARWVNPARYHATLHFLGDHPLLRRDVIDVAVAAANTLCAAPIEWNLHGATSFHGRQPPCVLLGPVPEPLQRLWQDLRHALIMAGQGRYIASSFTPHVTVAYSYGALLDAMSIEPVTWRLEDIVLIHSVIGQSDYRVLARWPLQVG
jgi:2'-5' RNA ligase